MQALSADLVGRVHERRLLAAALRRLENGEGGLLVLEARAGLGKTALARWLVTEAETRRLTVLTARANAVTQTTPFMVAAQLLPEVMLETRQEHGVDEPAAGRAGATLFSAVERAREAIEVMALQPLLLLVDDLHWTDAPSMAVLAAAAELAVTLPVLVVVTTRPSVAPHADALDRAFGRAATHIGLDPLGTGEAHELAASITGARVGPGLQRLIDGVAGSPLLVIQLLQGLRSDGELSFSGGVVETERLALPDSLRADVNRRLRRQGDDALDAVRVLAVAGAWADLLSIAQLLERSPDTVARSLERVADAGLVEVAGDGYALPHDLLRDAVYLDIPAPTRAALHRRMAEVLQQRGSEPAVIAAHLALGASPGDEDAIAWLASAADDVGQAAPTTALLLVDKALGLTGDDHAAQQSLQRARLDLLIQLGRVEEAATLALVLARQLGADLSPAELAALFGRAAGLLVLQRRAEEGLVLLNEGLAAVDDEAAHARLVAQRAMVKMTLADHVGAAGDAQDAVARTKASGDAVGASIALAVAGRIGTFDHDYHSGVEPGLEAVLVAEREPTGEAHLHLPCFYYALTGLDIDDLAMAQRAIDRGRAAADRLGHVYALPLYCGAAASVHYRRGELDDAWAEASAGLSLARDTGSHQASMWCEAFRALVALLRGELGAAHEHAAASEEAWAAHSSPLGVDFMALASARVAASAGDEAKALQVLDGAWEAFGAIGVRSCQPLLGTDLVRVAIAEGHRDRAVEVAAALTDVAGVSGLEAHRALAAQAVGLVDADVALLQEAVRRHDHTGRTLDAALCLVDAAAVAVDTGIPGASELVAEARRRLSLLGAHGAAAKLQDTTADGFRSGGARFGWQSLTPTELAIVSLVANGLTNAAIADRRGVSRRTVESHLVRVYTKLGISNRVQLAVEAAERGLA